MPTFDASRTLMAMACDNAVALAASMPEEEALSPLGIFVAGLAASFGEHLSNAEVDDAPDDRTPAERRRAALQISRVKQNCAFAIRLVPSLLFPRPEPDAAHLLKTASNMLADNIIKRPLPDVDDRTVDVDALLKLLPSHLSLSEMLIGCAEDMNIRGINLPRHRELHDKVAAAAERLSNETPLNTETASVETVDGPRI